MMMSERRAEVILARSRDNSLRGHLRPTSAEIREAMDRLNLGPHQLYEEPMTRTTKTVGSNE